MYNFIKIIKSVWKSMNNHFIPPKKKEIISIVNPIEIIYFVMPAYIERVSFQYVHKNHIAPFLFRFFFLETLGKRKKRQT